MSQRIDFWFEFASTYSYLSAMRIDAAAAARGLEVRWRPFLLGPIFKAQGWDTSPFNLYPAKGRYMWRDMARRTSALGLPFRRPDPFPQNSLLAARCALLALDEPWGRDFCRAVFSAEFADGADISDPLVLGELIEACGGVSEAVLRGAHGEHQKQALRANVEDAQALGLFGAPSFVVAGDLFWGDDRLEDALDWAVAGGS